MKIHENPFFRGAFVLIVINLALSFSGCATTAGGLAIAGGEQAVGDVYANAKLAKIDGSPAGTAAQQAAVTDLTRVAVDLKAFAAGTLTPYELGNIEAQLNADKLALSSNTAAINQVTSVLNIFAGAVTSSGLVLPAQALVQGNVANIVSGMNISIQTYEGQWNVTNPGVWPSPNAAPAATAASAPAAAIPK